VIRSQRRGFRTRTLFTSLLDPVAYPAAELAALYHERWELELGFDELKTHTLEREEALRSKTPSCVRQKAKPAVVRRSDGGFCQLCR
jgi:IS4 transposase